MISVQDLSRVENKQYKDYSIAYLPSIAVISLIQDEKTELTPVIEKNDFVKEGQVIATLRNTSIAHIHSPVPGKVLDFYQVTMPNGKKTKAILIKMEGSFSFLGKKHNLVNWQYSTSLMLTQQFRDMGIINTFEKPISLSCQIDKLKENGKQPLVIRLYDSDPNICINSFITEKFPDKIFEACAILANTIDTSNVVFLSKKDSFSLPDDIEIKKLFKAISVDSINIDVQTYPNGTYNKVKEFALTYLNKKYQKNFNECLAIDSNTCYDIYNGIVKEFPVIEKFIQIDGDAIANTGIYKIRIGSTLRNIFEECGGFIEKPAKIIINGLLKGIAISDLDTPITKYVQSIHVLSSRGFPDQRQTACIRCGRCHEICPENIHPEKIYSNYYSDTPIKQTITNTIALCTNCGLCNAVCPSRIPLTQTIQMIKDINDEKNL